MFFTGVKPKKTDQIKYYEHHHKTAKILIILIEISSSLVLKKTNEF